MGLDGLIAMIASGASIATTASRVLTAMIALDVSTATIALGVLIVTIVSFSAVISSDLVLRRSGSQDGGATPTTMATTHTAIRTMAVPISAPSQ